MKCNKVGFDLEASTSTFGNNFILLIYLIKYFIPFFFTCMILASFYYFFYPFFYYFFYYFFVRSTSELKLWVRLSQGILARVGDVLIPSEVE